MTEENKQAQILYTHYHRAYIRDNTNCDEAEVIDFQLRLYGVEAIRLVKMGKMTIDEDVLRVLRLAKLEFDFADMN